MHGAFKVGRRVEERGEPSPGNPKATLLAEVWRRPESHCFGDPEEKEMTFLVIRCLTLPLGQAGTFTQWGLR